LVIELRDRLKNWDMPQGDMLAHSEIQSIATDNDVFAEAESALITLGYKPVEAAKMVSLASKQKPDAKSEELIRIALRNIAG
jgi:Holliday junction DNA helicase RuvA